MSTKKLFSITILIIASFHLYGQQVGHAQVAFIDSSRSNRSVPVEIYYPSAVAGNNTPISPGVFPVISFGHGFVMAWSVYQNLWTDLVSEGYILAFPTTEGGFSPVHGSFGADLKFLVTKIKSSGAGASVPASSVGNTSAIMGHSMGGGSSFLAAENNQGITTMVSFAAANTNPSSITAAQQVSVPTLIFSGTNDCVAPAAEHQDIIYDSTAADYKTQVYISGGGHCYFADYSFNCAFGESSCSPIPTITRAEQQVATADFLKLWLAFYLKGNCSKGQEFQDSLSSSARITFRQSLAISCPTSIQEASDSDKNGFTIFPNPARDIITIEFVLNRPSDVNIEIINALGQTVNVIEKKKLQSAKHEIKFSPKELGLSDGVYHIRMIGEHQVFSKLLFVSN